MTRPKRSRRGFLPPCPTCGGPKGKRTSAQCHPCHLAAVAAAKAENPPCPVCGGEKANAKARGIKAAEARRILEEHEAARGSDIFCK